MNHDLALESGARGCFSKRFPGSKFAFFCYPLTGARGCLWVARKIVKKLNLEHVPCVADWGCKRVK
jgi:hypothetical protein